MTSRDAAAQTAFGPMVLAAIEHHEPPTRRLVDDDLAESFLPNRFRFLVRMARSDALRRAAMSAIDRSGPGLWASIACRKRYIDELGIPEKDAQLLTKYRRISEYFDEAIDGVKSPKTVSNFIIGQIFRRVETENDKEAFDVATTPAQLNELVKLLDSGKIRNNLAKATLEKMLDSGKGVLEFISESDMGGMDENALLELCKAAVEGNPKAVEDFRNGKEKAIKALVGNVMKNSRGKADAQAAEAKIKELIG